MTFITITTDLGYQDPQVASVKGFLLSNLKDVQLIDVSHHVKPFHIIEAAQILSECYSDFPIHTIHIIGVAANYERTPVYVAAEINEHYFVTQQTGILSLITQSEASWIYEINPNDKANYKSPIKNILGKAAVHLAKKKDPSLLGPVLPAIKEVRLPEPKFTADSMTGNVTYTTSHNNIKTNIHQRYFARYAHFQRLVIHYTRNDILTEISNSYFDVDEGEVVCFFDEQGFLEIGIRGGNASDLLSLYVGKNIWIEFKNEI